MADTAHLIIVIATFLYLVIFSLFCWYLIDQRKWDFQDYEQPDPTDTTQFYRIHGNVSPKPVVGTPCTDQSDCTSGVLLACSDGICVSMTGGLCESDSDCVPMNTCISNNCIAPLT